MVRVLNKKVHSVIRVFLSFFHYCLPFRSRKKRVCRRANPAIFFQSLKHIRWIELIDSTVQEPRVALREILSQVLFCAGCRARQ